MRLKIQGQQRIFFSLNTLLLLLLVDTELTYVSWKTWRFQFTCNCFSNETLCSRFTSNNLFLCRFRNIFTVFFAFVSLTSLITMTSSHPMADDKSSARAPQTLEDVLHHHLGINKRDTASLLQAAKIAPDQCLHNHHFQDVMNALIQVSTCGCFCCCFF